MPLSEQKRVEIVLLWNGSNTKREIARMMKVAYATVLDVIGEHELAKRKKQEQKRKPNTRAFSYDNHDELSRHYAGAEFEDDRPYKLRGKDWPIRG
jgi:hypothetical protein